MIKEFIAISLSVILIFAFVVYDIITKDSTIKNKELSFTKLTTIIEPAFMSSSLEDRFLFITKSINSIYPELPKIDKLEYVYVK